MEENKLPAPVFKDEKGTFTVIFYKRGSVLTEDNEDLRILEFCKHPKTRKELIEFLGYASNTYAMQKFINPLVEKGLLELSIPDKPASKHQTYKSK